MQTDTSNASRILYVEDLETDQALLPTVLPESQYRISIASNGQEAVERLKDEKFDLVLMDIEMPVMDGIEATRYIRNELKHSNDDLPILALTVHNTNEKRAAALEAGIDDFIPKPFDHDELQQKIEYWIQHDQTDSFIEAAQMFENTDLSSYPILDGKQIESFLQFIGIERTRELIEDSMSEYDKKTDMIFDTNTTADDLAKEMHAIASMSGNLGLSRFSMSCRTLMNDLKNGDIEDRMTRLMDVQALYDESVQKLKKIIDAMG
ncbi:MAG: response regulator [Pseudomonadota bacterium]